MKYKYVVFDLDGTITDSSEGITKCVAYALANEGIKVEDLSDLFCFIGPPLVDSFREFYGMDRETAERATAKYRERFSTVGMFENRVYEGFEEMLGRLKDAGCRLAVATSKPQKFTEQILDHFGLTGYFDYVAGATFDNSHSSKPELIGRALDAMGCEEKNRSSCAIMVGDRKFDIEGANALGIDSIGVQYGFAPENELERSGATYLAESPAELTDIIL